MKKAGAPHVTELIYSFQTGGSERIGVEIARYLHSRGRDVSVCATHFGAGPSSALLDEENIPWLAADPSGRSRIRRATQIFDHLRRTRCTVLHVHHFNMLAIAYAPARLAGVSRIVLTEHSDYMLRQDPRTLSRARRFAPRADAITVVHDGLREFIEDRIGPLPSAVVVIPNGVDTVAYSPDPGGKLDLTSPGGATDSVRICSVGRLHPDKDHLNLLQAAVRLRERGITGFTILLVGEGPEREPIERFITEHRLNNAVVLLGDRADVRDLLREMDVFALSSRTEGVPVAMLEAMSTGLPCVATDVGGVADALSTGGGVVVPRKEPDALAEALARFIDSPDLRKREGIAARRTAETRFDRDAIFSKYESLLLT